MIQLQLPPELVLRAKDLYDFKAKGSFTDMKSSIYGAIGELVVSEYLGVELNNTKDYDLIVNGETFDVKTKRCTSTPLDYYTVMIPLTSLHQQCSFYIFTRVHENLKVAWILGYTSKQFLLSEGVLKRKGEKDYNFTVVADCYNLKINQLWSVF